MNLKNLTAEERETLRKQFFEEERKKEEERKAKIEGYKTLVDETVLNAMEKIKGVSSQIGQVKKSIFADFKRDRKSVV